MAFLKPYKIVHDMFTLNRLLYLSSFKEHLVPLEHEYYTSHELNIWFSLVIFYNIGQFCLARNGWVAAAIFAVESYNF